MARVIIEFDDKTALVVVCTEDEATDIYNSIWDLGTEVQDVTFEYVEE